MRPTNQGARSKQRNSVATESAHESTVSQGGYSSVLFNRVSTVLWVSINFTVRQLQPGPPKDFDSSFLLSSQLSRPTCAETLATASYVGSFFSSLE